jgi:TATA-box binding protein (TBP) (component of TFIID and TFIIIB)
MLKKLELMEVYFKSDKTHCVEANNISKEIKNCKEALQRLNNDDYSLPEFKEYLNNINICNIINNDAVDTDAIDLHNKNRKYEQEQIELDMKIFFDMFSKSLNWWD